jgi:protease-4
MDLKAIFLILGILLFIVVGISVMMFLFFGGAGFQYGDRIAVIEISGSISSGDPLLSDNVNAQELGDLFEEAREDDSVMGVVLRINSGGGGVVETKEVVRALEKLSDEKTVISWIGDVGASGAYYIAAYTDYIIADEDAMVGSIGVISVFQNYKDLMEEKLGINTTVIKSGEFKDMGSAYRAMTEDEKERFQEIVDKVHKEFLDTVIEKRNLGFREVEEIEDGQIFLGSEALGLSLVDATGGFGDALDFIRVLENKPDAEPYYMGAGGYDDLLGFSYGLGRGIGDSLGERFNLKEMPLKWEG